jgi:ribosome-associated protein
VFAAASCEDAAASAVAGGADGGQTMGRRKGQGYYVDGTFVAAGSAADASFREELNGDEPSRSARKRASEELQVLGEQLVTLRPDLQAGLTLPDKLREALVEARRITNFEGLRRHKQFLGKLMRLLDEPEVAAIVAALAEQHRQQGLEAQRHHELESWRDRLIASDDALGDWLAVWPRSDAPQLRSLIRQARREAQAAAGAKPRHGRAYRQLFIFLREQSQPVLDDSDGSPA